MSISHNIRYPGENEAYRTARNELLQAEYELRQKVEAVAAMRRGLPLGGIVKEDYVFAEQNGDGTAHQTKLSGLFADGKDTLMIYSFMYGPEADPCPSCTSFLDGLDGNVPHINQRMNLAVVARSPISRIQAWAGERGWSNLRLLSSSNNSYNADYFAETPEGHQMPACNVFQRTDDGIYHYYAAEMLYAPVDGHPRHMDMMWPLWNVLDLTPDGRGTDWGPQLSYD